MKALYVAGASDYLSIRVSFRRSEEEADAEQGCRSQVDSSLLYRVFE